MSASYPSRGSSRGFTLIEVLVSVAVGAVLLTALYATFFSVFRAGGTAGAALEERLRAGRFVDRFSMDIHGALPDAGGPFGGFTGEPRGMGSSISFASFAHPSVKKGFPSSGVSGVAYSTEDDETGLKVYREAWNPYMEERTRVEVLSRVRSFEISYFNGSSWVKAWDSSREKGLPAAVRATVTFDGGEEFRVLARTMVSGASG